MELPLNSILQILTVEGSWGSSVQYEEENEAWRGHSMSGAKIRREFRVPDSWKSALSAPPAFSRVWQADHGGSREVLEGIWTNAI